MKTCEILGNGTALRCGQCGKTTHHLEDVRRRYCPNCREFLTDDSLAPPVGALLAQPEWDMTLIGFVLDKSASMSDQREAATMGFNHFVKQIRDCGKPAKLTLTLFDTEFRIVHDNVDLQTVPDMAYGDYVPDGLTALYDAVGHCVAAMERELSKYAKARTVVVVMTDGDENSSREFSHEAVRRLISSKEAQGNWSFVYLSSALDGWRHAQSMGIAAGNTVQYSTSTTSGTICAAAMSTTRYLLSREGSTKAFASSNAGDYTGLGGVVGQSSLGNKSGSGQANSS